MIVINLLINTLNISSKSRNKYYQNLVKPCLDIAVSLLLIILLSPLLLLLTIILGAANKGSPFFVESRPGRNGKLFNIVKFKTMTDSRDSRGNLLPDAQRLTSIGKILRSLSLDELPQLVNVITGTMSIIGPRPLGKAYLRLYNDFQKRRHDVKPGITGWAQVNGRNAITWEEKFSLDVWYVENISFSLDCRIILKTVQTIFRREGIGLKGSSINSVILEDFKGTENGCSSFQ